MAICRNWLVGSTTGSLAGSNTLTSFQDLFVSKYDSSGTLQWTKQQGVAGQYSAVTALDGKDMFRWGLVGQHLAGFDIKKMPFSV